MIIWSPRKKQIARAERQIAVSYIVAENFLLINITLCGNNWRAPSHSAQTLERRSNQSAHESRSAESQFHTYEISRVLRDEGGMIQQNPVSTIGRGKRGWTPTNGMTAALNMWTAFEPSHEAEQ